MQAKSDWYYYSLLWLINLGKTEAGNIIVMNISTDVTDQKLTEKKLAEKEQQLQKSIEKLEMMIELCENSPVSLVFQLFLL